MKRLFHGLTLLVSLAAGICLAPAQARAEDPEINPYECLGRYEAATGNRTIGQIKQEIQKRLPELDKPEEPKSVNAMKHCVVAMLMSRAGDTDAPKHYEAAVQNDPNEPGYEMWWGNHYTLFRGARSPVTETAEPHYYEALRKLEEKRKHSKYRDYHKEVESWTRKRLMVLYQQDGQHLIPGKQWLQSSSATYRPIISAGAIASISKDTRDFNRKGDWNEARTFTTEKDFANSDVRAGGARRPPPYGRGLQPFEIYAIPRNPLRYQVDAKLRYRQTPVGTFDFNFNTSHAEQAQISSFYFPAGCHEYALCTDIDGSTNGLNDVDVREFGGSFERVFPLYPIMDAKVGVSYRRVKRTGVVEFLPNRVENFNMYEGKLALSRFLSSDKLTLELGYALLDIPEGPGPVPEQMREKHIRSALLEYALYSPLVLPSFTAGQPAFVRTPTRGWYFYTGIVLDDETYGTRTLRKRDIFAGSRFEGSGFFDITLQGTWATAKQTFFDLNQSAVFTDPQSVWGGIRVNTTPQFRIINPDALPGMKYGFDSLMLVTPASVDFGIEGSKDYENFRVGPELWGRLFLPGAQSAFLLTAGYNYQYFWDISKGIHIFQANVRWGWGDL